ncbi:hypothetical protein Tco_1450132 [Tanacetum coccineum]
MGGVDSSKNHDFTFSNPLFDIDEDFTLSDESFSEEDIPKENFIIFSNPLFDLDEEIASTKTPEDLQANSNAIESLPPSHIPVADNDSLMEEIDLFLADDGSIPPGIESDDVDSVDDDTSISLPECRIVYVDYPNSGNSTIDVVEDIPVDVPNVLPTHPILEQDFIPTSEFFAYVVWIFLPFLAYPVIPPSLLSFKDEDTIFDPGISIYHSSFMPDVSHRSGTFIKFNTYRSHLNERSGYHQKDRKPAIMTKLRLGMDREQDCAKFKAMSKKMPSQESHY